MKSYVVRMKKRSFPTSNHMKKMKCNITRQATEKYLPSKLEDPEKRPHNIPFPPSAQTAKNVGLTIKCVECGKPRLSHSKHKLKEQQVKTLKSFLSKIIYICGSTLSEYEGPEG